MPWIESRYGYYNLLGVVVIIIFGMCGGCPPAGISAVQIIGGLVFTADYNRFHTEGERIQARIDDKRISDYNGKHYYLTITEIDGSSRTASGVDLTVSPATYDKYSAGDITEFLRLEDRYRHVDHVVPGNLISNWILIPISIVMWSIMIWLLTKISRKQDALENAMPDG